MRVSKFKRLHDIATARRAPGVRRRIVASVIASGVVLLAAAGCSDDGGGADERISLATWNAGLAPNFVSLAAERSSAAIAAAVAIDADVICLQEVWIDADVATATASAKLAGYTTVYVDAMKEDVANLAIACTEGDTVDLAPCAQKHCVPSDNLVGCVQTKCGPELAALSPTCLGCLASNLHLDFNGILDACAKGGGSYTFSGHHGLMLLARVPVTKTERLVLDSTLIQRAVLHARVAAGAGRPAMDVYCTHLAAGLSSIPYTGEHGSWEGEQAVQIDELGTWITATTTAGNAVALLGDLNCGPAVSKDIVAEMPANWKKVLDLGFVDPWPASPGAACTFCGDNTLVASGADTGGEGAIIDHIALRGFDGGAVVVRINDSKVSVDTASGKKETHLSDHFGLRAQLVR